MAKRQAVSGIFGMVGNNHKDPTKRDYTRMVLFGEQGQGKSSWIAGFVENYMKVTTGTVKRKVLICDPSNARAFDKYAKITLAEIMVGEVRPGERKATAWTEGVRVLRGLEDWREARFFRVLAEYFKNGLLILDESRDMLGTSDKVIPAAQHLLTIHRNNCVDLLLVSHNFMDLPRAIRKQFRIYITFKTNEMPDGPEWFRERNLPGGLYNCWLLLKNISAPASIISPFMWHDADTGRSEIHADPNQYDQILVTVSRNPFRQITLRQYLNAK